MTSRPLYIVGFMVAVAAVFGTAVTGIQLGSARVLERNNAFLRQRSLVTVFGYGDPRGLGPEGVAEIVSGNILQGERLADPETGEVFDLIEAYSGPDRRELLAYGFPLRGLGLWGPVEAILALRPDLSRSHGLVIVAHAETPGLGGRIEEPVFTAQFRDGVVTSPPSSGAFVRLAAPGTPDPDGRQIDAITGATQTCMAFERMLNRGLAGFHRAMAARHVRQRRERGHDGVP
ncbi:MAG: FMN-binding protein [Lentisphaeria bacterium]|nr:FMN-binding protein [Lentisphaeria bacterium]